MNTHIIKMFVKLIEKKKKFTKLCYIRNRHRLAIVYVEKYELFLLVN